MENITNTYDKSPEEIYKYRLGSTARAACSPASPLQAHYMSSDYEPLTIDPQFAYIQLLNMLGHREFITSLFDLDEEEHQIYNPDGSDTMKILNIASTDRKENIREVYHDLEAMHLEGDFSMDMPDIGEKILAVLSLEENSDDPVPYGDDNLVIPIDRNEGDIEIQYFLNQYSTQVDEGIELGLRLYSPDKNTDFQDEIKSELLDIVNLCYQIGYRNVQIPQYLDKYREVLEGSGLRVDEFGPDSVHLKWKGRCVTKLEFGEAGYVLYKYLDSDKLYYPSLLYGRGYAIECSAETTVLISGLPGIFLYKHIRRNARLGIRSKIKDCVFYFDHFRYYFQIPLQSRYRVRWDVFSLKSSGMIYHFSQTRKDNLFMSMLSELDPGSFADWGPMLVRRRGHITYMRWLMIVPQALQLYANMYEERNAAEDSEEENEDKDRRRSRNYRSQ